MSDFNFELALSLYNSTDRFPVDFDDAWIWYEFSTKGNAKRSFDSCGFIEKVDYEVVSIISNNSDNQAFLSPQEKAVLQNTQKIKLTLECFKSWGMMIGTPKGKEVRKYFLECEKVAKEKSKSIILGGQDLENLFSNLLDKYLAPKLDKIEKYEKACEEHDGAGYVINSNVSKKSYPSEAVYAYEYCALKKLDKRYWRTFSRRYAQFVRVGTNQSPPKRNGKLFIYGELYYYAEMALANVMEII